MPYCPNCGSEIEEGKAFCADCGAPLSPGAQVPSAPPQQATTAVPAQRAIPAGSVIGAILGGLLLIGSFMTWARVGYISIPGTEGDGKITIGVAIFGLVGALDGLLAKRMRIGAAIMMILAGLAGAFICWSDLWNTSGLSGLAEIGGGLWLCAISSTFLIFAGLVALVRRK